MWSSWWQDRGQERERKSGAWPGLGRDLSWEPPQLNLIWGWLGWDGQRRSTLIAEGDAGDTATLWWIRGVRLKLQAMQKYSCTRTHNTRCPRQKRWWDFIKMLCVTRKKVLFTWLRPQLAAPSTPYWA
jgi:hypothetical protein